MKLLLDTHVWLWSLMDPDQLSKAVLLQLKDPDNELWLCPISIWEALLLIEKDRVQVDGAPTRWIEMALGAFPVRDAVPSREVALVTRSLDLPHEDPADRFIAASAVVYKLTLVTADKRLLRSRRYEVLRVDGR